MLRTLYTEDIRNMMIFVFHEVKRKAEENNIPILQNVVCGAIPDSCLLFVEFAHCYADKSLSTFIKESEAKEFSNTVALFLEELPTYTDDFIFIKSYISSFGYLVFKNSKDIQVKKSR